MQRFVQGWNGRCSLFPNVSRLENYSKKCVPVINILQGSWINFIHDNHENEFFAQSDVLNFNEAKERELQIFPVYTVAAFCRIGINVGLWFYRESRVQKYIRPDFIQTVLTNLKIGYKFMKFILCKRLKVNHYSL